MEISLIENIQRENLNPIEEALAYKRLLNEFHLKQDELAERVSKSRAAVTNSMRLLKLDERVQQMVIDDMLTTGHARALLGIEDPELQVNVATRVFDEKLSVREVEKLVRKIQEKKPEQPKSDPVDDFIYADLEEKMKAAMGTKVSIKQKAKGKGKIEIEYYSREDLERIFEAITKTKEKDIMSPILEYVYQVTGIDTAYILAGMLLLLLILLILIMVALCKLKNLRRKLDRYMRGKDAESLEDTILSCIEKADKVDQMNQILREDIIGLRKNQKITFQKMGMVKYNAFREMSGDLSYALALLDQENNGFLINSVYGNEGGYSYIKEIKNGESEILLSEDEQKALEKAKSQA